MTPMAQALWTTAMVRPAERDTLSRMNAGTAWAATAQRQGGVVTRAQLRRHGLGDPAVDRLLHGGALERACAGVFVARGAPITVTTRLWIATLATHGIVGFASAAALWRCVDTLPALVSVVLPHRRRVDIPDGVRVYRVGVPDHAITRVAGIPVTARPWTIMDVLGRMHRRQGLVLADRALQQGWITPRALERRLAEYPGRTGNTFLREVLDSSGDRAAAESERILHRLLRRAGVRGWRPNFPIEHGGSVVAVADVALPRVRLVIEVDGWAFHSDVERFQRDRRRQNALVALGWRVLRFTWIDLVERPGYVVATIRSESRRK